MTQNGTSTGQDLMEAFFTAVSEASTAYQSENEDPFRQWIRVSAEGDRIRPIPFPPATNRYHLYISHAAPYSSSVLMMWKLKGLEKAISVDIVHWRQEDLNDWYFDSSEPGVTMDTVSGERYMSAVYRNASMTAGIMPGESPCEVKLPVLFDKQRRTIINNEWSDILRMLNSEFNEFSETEGQKRLDLYPQSLRAEIDSLNEWIHPKLNEGVIKVKNALNQQDRDAGLRDVFQALERVEEILSEKRYLTGSSFTEADIRLFVTLIRFDLVYYPLFKCNSKRIVDYPHTWGYVREIYQMRGIRDTVNLDHIVKHYYTQEQQVIPVVSTYELETAHKRRALL